MPCAAVFLAKPGPWQLRCITSCRPTLLVRSLLPITHLSPPRDLVSFLGPRVPWMSRTYQVHSPTQQFSAMPSSLVLSGLVLFELGQSSSTTAVVGDMPEFVTQEHSIRCTELYVYIKSRPRSYRSYFARRLLLDLLCSIQRIVATER